MPAITVENVSKKYRKGQFGYRTLREDLYNLTGQLIHLRRGNKRSYDERYMWALRDVSFEVKQGEKLGIIGANGSGKTTMLRLLAGITNPTEGKISLKGRMGVLIELMAGFHPELTGRENIYLNGAIMGMGRREIRRRFDEIVAFAEIEDWIDTPIKRYSSGMHVRLGFAVAAHLDPEILLVDEVLAVGDASFQKKCLGKMDEAAGEGRTVIFVSHNMGSISRLCSRALLLDGGRLEKDGISTDVISDYLKKNSKADQRFLQPADHSIPLCLIEAEAFSEGSSTSGSFQRHKPITIRMKHQVNREISSAHLYSTVLASDGTVVFGTGDADTDQRRLGLRKPGTYVCQYRIPALVLNEGDYTINISLGIPYQKNFQENNGILSFTVVDIEPTERFVHQRRAGVIWLDIPWDYPNDSPFS